MPNGVCVVFELYTDSVNIQYPVTKRLHFRIAFAEDLVLYRTEVPCPSSSTDKARVGVIGSEHGRNSRRCRDHVRLTGALIAEGWLGDSMGTGTGIVHPRNQATI